jgi:hypothetical protein
MDGYAGTSIAGGFSSGGSLGARAILRSKQWRRFSNHRESVGTHDPKRVCDAGARG